jgi:hypothetical protein
MTSATWVTVDAGRLAPQLLAYGNFVALAGREKFRCGKFSRAERLDNFWDGEPGDLIAPTDPVKVNGTCLMVARNVVTEATLWHAPSATHFASVSGGGGANRNSFARKHSDRARLAHSVVGFVAATRLNGSTVTREDVS